MTAWVCSCSFVYISVHPRTDSRPLLHKIAPSSRCPSGTAGFVSRETFIAFQKTYDEIVNTLFTCQDEDERWKFMRSMFDFDDYADTVPINAANLPVTFDAVQRLMSFCVEFSGKLLYSHSRSLEQGELMTTLRKC